HVYLFISCCLNATTATTPLSLHDALPIFQVVAGTRAARDRRGQPHQRHRDEDDRRAREHRAGRARAGHPIAAGAAAGGPPIAEGDRKSTRLNSSHVSISYAVFCLKKRNIE